MVVAVETSLRLLGFGLVTTLALGGLFGCASAELRFPAAAENTLNTQLKGFSQNPSKKVAGRTLFQPKSIAKFYRQRRHRPAWLDEQGRPLDQVRPLVDAIASSWRDGLAPVEYHLDRLRAWFPSDEESFVPLAGNDAFGAEILLTDGFLALASHLHGGRLDPKELDIDWLIRRPRTDLVTALENAVGETGVAETLKSLSPDDERYNQLKGALALYLDEDGNPIRGLPPAGAPKDVPPSRAIVQLSSNLERLRWLPRDRGARHLFVDIADFQLTAYEGTNPAVKMKIIVGHEYKRTPMLATEVSSVVLNPYWNIPRSILADEILPRAKINPSFLVERDIRVYDHRGGVRREISPRSIDWSRVDREGNPYVFRQGSGPRNPLGSIKFPLKNSLSVYLHGTSNPKLFNRKQRTLSHGCIRVENPLDLATFLLKGSQEPWTRRILGERLEDGLEESVKLAETVPVYVWYRTVSFDKKGRPKFRSDVYGWDQIVASALRGQKQLVPAELQTVIRRR